MEMIRHQLGHIDIHPRVMRGQPVPDRLHHLPRHSPPSGHRGSGQRVRPCPGREWSQNHHLLSVIIALKPGIERVVAPESSAMDSVLLCGRVPRARPFAGTCARPDGPQKCRRNVGGRHGDLPLRRPSRPPSAVRAPFPDRGRHRIVPYKIPVFGIQAQPCAFVGGQNLIIPFFRSSSPSRSSTISGDQGTPGPRHPTPSSAWAGDTKSVVIVRRVAELGSELKQPSPFATPPSKAVSRDVRDHFVGITAAGESLNLAHYAIGDAIEMGLEDRLPIDGIRH